MVQKFGTIGLPALFSFHTVARQGGISAAAEHLGIAKSGVSRHVSQLEAHFGVRLLERGARSVRLTPVGARLDHRIRSILAEVDLLDDIAREESAGVTGQVTIAATPEISSLLATGLIPVLRKKHPDMTLVIRPAYAFEDMQDPDTDIAFRVGTFKDDRLVAREIGAFRFFLVASPKLVNDRGVRRPEDLEDAPCLTFRSDRPRATWTFNSSNDDVSVEIAGPVAVRNFAILFELAVAGQGYAFLPEFMVDQAIRKGALVRCLSEYTSRPYPLFLTFRPGARRIARVDAAIEAAEEFVSTLFSQPEHRLSFRK